MAAIAPGFLAAFSGHDTDEAALSRAEHALKDLPDHPGGHAIDDWRDSLARAPQSPPAKKR